MNFKSFAVAVFAGVVLSAACMTTVEAATRTEIKRIVIEEAENSRVPVALALAVARVESNFIEDALSSVGARGVMQIMPKTGSSVFGVNKEILMNLNKEITIMHPGPINRGVELTSDVADSGQSIILEQVENGVAIRMAILYLLASKINNDER